MSFFNDLKKLLTGAVGNNLDNEKEDVRTIRRSFKDISFTREDENETDHQDKPLGIITRGLDNTIKKFQKENDLREDGLVYPDGETENALLSHLNKKDKSPETVLGQRERKANENPFLQMAGKVVSKDQIRGVFERVQNKNIPKPKIKPKKLLEEKLEIQHNFEERDQPNKLDATGRMIREEDAEDKEKKTLKEETFKNKINILPPAYKKDWFKQKGGQENWKQWRQTLNADSSLSVTEKQVFLDIFAAEGGSFASDGTTLGGVTQGTLNDLKNETFGQEIRRKHGDNVKPKDLNINDIKDFYKGYNDWLFRGAAKAHKGRNPDDPRSGSQMLETIGDAQVARTIADTLFRVGASAGARLVQESLNKALPIEEHIGTSGGIGTESFKALRRVAVDPKRKRQFLDYLGDARDKKYPDGGDKNRNQYFRFEE